MTPALLTKTQAKAIAVLHARLDRTCPDLEGMTFTRAGDLIIELRAEAKRAETAEGGTRCT